MNTFDRKALKASNRALKRAVKTYGGKGKVCQVHVHGINQLWTNVIHLVDEIAADEDSAIAQIGPILKNEGIDPNDKFAVAIYAIGSAAAGLNRGDITFKEHHKSLLLASYVKRHLEKIGEDKNDHLKTINLTFPFDGQIVLGESGAVQVELVKW